MTPQPDAAGLSCDDQQVAIVYDWASQHGSEGQKLAPKAALAVAGVATAQSPVGEDAAPAQHQYPLLHLQEIYCDVLALAMRALGTVAMA